MTKIELIEALQASPADDNEEVIIWIERCRRTVTKVDTDFEGLTLNFGPAS
jgi:hypothetical protein